MNRAKSILWVGMIIWFWASVPARAATITVTSTADSGPGSLRDAIASASPGDIITFNLPSPATITLGSTLTINTSLTISGPGAASLAISGNNAVQVVNISAGTTVTISGVTIENGRATGGAGIDNSGTLTVASSTVSGNSTTDASGTGGGIFNHNSGTLTVTDSTVSNNSASLCGGGSGGGIYSFGPLTVTNSTISGNSGCFGGGGIFNNGSVATVTNSTVSGNTAVSFGGGVLNWYGTLTLTSSTVSANSAASGGGVTSYGNATLTAKSSIVTNSPSGGNCSVVVSGTLTSQGYNLSDDTSCSTFFTQTDNLNNTPAGLDPNGLQNNGGPTQTMALLSTSPAVDAIPTSACTDTSGNPVTTDQRGIARPQGSACDIGAYELIAVPFAAFSAQVEIEAGPPSSFEAGGAFTLGAGSDGINPPIESVILQVGTFSTTIPAGSFVQDDEGRFEFEGVIDGVALEVQFEPLGSNNFKFQAEGRAANLTGTANPVTVSLTIGNDGGSKTVTAESE